MRLERSLKTVVERRLLVNYRTDPEVTARLLPAPLRPQLVHGWAVSGICLIRLGGVRPGFLPAAAGLRSENAAHRIAVEWDTPDGVARGVYIPRRDTASRLNALAGGRVFPGVHHRTRFDVQETGTDLRIGIAAAGVDVHARTATALTGSHLFADVAAASAFFRGGACGWSPGRHPGHLDGIELRTTGWQVTPAALLSVRSAFFDAFPPGAAVPDCAVLMRDVPATWHPLPALPVAACAGAVR